VTIELTTQSAKARPRRDHARGAHLLAALAVLLGLLTVSSRTLAAPPNGTKMPAGQPTRDSVQPASHAEMLPADRPFAPGQQQPAAKRAAPLYAPAAEEKTRLAAQSATRPRTGAAPGAARQLLTTGASLTLVLGVFAAVAWTMRRGMPKVLAQRLPSDVLDVLGQATLGHRQQVQLVRLGHKLLLINVSASGAETLAEVTEPAEVDRLTALCRGTSSRSATPSFRDVLQQFRGATVTTGPIKTRSLGAGLGKSEVTDG
jgi:flagellar biogenesis protein FliO